MACKDLIRAFWEPQHLKYWDRQYRKFYLTFGAFTIVYVIVLILVTHYWI